MASNLSTIQNVKPRPYLHIVKTLKLNIVQPPKLDKSKQKNIPSNQSKIAANDHCIPEGSRNTMLFSLAGSMRRKGMSQDAIHAALIEENKNRCDPPLEMDEIDAICNSIMRYPTESNEDLLRSFTDLGNSNRFKVNNSEKVIYVPNIGWFIWNGLKWKHDENNLLITEIAKKLVREIYSEGETLNDDDRLKIAKHAKNSQNIARIKAMIELAKSEPELLRESELIDANDFLFGVSNGVIDLKNGKLLQPNQNLLISRHSPVSYDKDAKCPTFLKFLDQITGGKKELIDYFQRIVGYCLTGFTTEQCLFFLYGNGANGKSTFLNVISQLLGSELAIDTPSETLMVKKGTNASNDVARMIGVRVVKSNEIEDSSLLAESLVKQMTGGDQLTARFLYKEYMSFTPKFKIFIAGNHKPTIRGRDHGIWRRIQLIPFDIKIPDSQKDKNLSQKLQAELPGILNWAIKGCLKWQSSGLKQPKVVLDAVNIYRKEMDLIFQWITQNCVTGEKYEHQSRRLYMNYSEWAQDGGYKPLSESVFSRELEQSFKKVGRRDANYFLGITTKLYLNSILQTTDEGY